TPEFAAHCSPAAGPISAMPRRRSSWCCDAMWRERPETDIRARFTSAREPVTRNLSTQPRKRSAFAPVLRMQREVESEGLASSSGEHRLDPDFNRCGHRLDRLLGEQAIKARPARKLSQSEKGEISHRGVLRHAFDGRSRNAGSRDLRRKLRKPHRCPGYPSRPGYRLCSRGVVA